MEWILVLGIAIHFVVNFLLLLAVNWGLQFCYGKLRCFFAALFAALYAAVCTIEPFSFLNGIVWRCTSLAVIGLIAYGWKKDSLQRILIFSLLRFALEGIGHNQLPWSIVLGVACFYIFRLETKGNGYIPISLSYRGKTVKFTALYDTGHNLRDPVTGRHVLVVDANIAYLLTGLTAEQLQLPIETLQENRGFCLLPYHTIGNRNGMLLTINVNRATIGKRIRKVTVALCGEKLDPDGKFQGLIGGAV